MHLGDKAGGPATRKGFGFRCRKGQREGKDGLFCGYFGDFLWNFVGNAGFDKALTLCPNTLLEWKPF